MGTAESNKPSEAAASEHDEHETLPPGGEAGSSATEPSSAGSSNVPAMFGRYQIERLLGQGGMGAVYLAQDTQLHRPVALKIPKFDDEPRPDLVERFYREARSAALLRHPNICPVFDVGEIDGTHYITMAYIEGSPLSNFVKDGKARTAGQNATLVRKIALALEEAHSHGIIHRDLKPLNIMIDKRHEPIIMDFGLAHQLQREKDPRLTQSGVLIGSPAYMSPEQLYGKRHRVGPASDVYALGVIFFELLTGKLPFEGPMSAIIAQVITRDPPPASSMRPGVDPAAEAICLKMMAREIENRYATMGEVAAALTAFLEGSGTRTSGPTSVRVPVGRSHGNPSSSAAAAPASAMPVPPPLPRRTSTQHGSGRREPLPRPPQTSAPQTRQPSSPPVAQQSFPEPSPTVVPQPAPAGSQRPSQISSRPLRAPELTPRSTTAGIARTPLLALRMLLAVALPPVAVMSCGKWNEVGLNLLLTLCGWIPGVVHAILIIITPSDRRRGARGLRQSGISQTRIAAPPAGSNTDSQGSRPLSGDGS